MRPPQGDSMAEQAQERWRDLSKHAKPQRDPRGHSLRIYDDTYDSHAFAALSPHDVLAYLALLRELKGSNNGDLSLPLTRASKCGISHSKTLARSLRALCAVGLVAITRKGGCKRGGQRQPTLYRVTDRECYAFPAKLLDAMKETNEWKRITSVQQALDLIQAADDAVKKEPAEKISLGHAVPCTASLRALVSPKTRAPRDAWIDRLGHGVTMAEKGSNPTGMRVAAGFSDDDEKAVHRAPRMPPLYVAIPTPVYACTHHHNRHRWLAQDQLSIVSSLTEIHF
jgi:hypothetical protein